MNPGLYGCVNCDPIYHEKFFQAQSSVDLNFQKMLTFSKWDNDNGGSFTIDRKVSHLYLHLKPNVHQVKARELTAVQKMQSKNFLLQEINHITIKRFNQGDLIWLDDLKYKGQYNCLPKDSLLYTSPSPRDS